MPHSLQEGAEGAQRYRGEDGFQQLTGLLRDVKAAQLVDLWWQHGQRHALLRVDRLSAQFGRPEDLEAGGVGDVGNGKRSAAAAQLRHLAPVRLPGGRWELTTAEVMLTCTPRLLEDQMLSELEAMCHAVGTTGAPPTCRAWHCDSRLLNCMGCLRNLKGCRGKKRRLCCSRIPAQDASMHALRHSCSNLHTCLHLAPAVITSRVVDMKDARGDLVYLTFPSPQQAAVATESLQRTKVRAAPAVARFACGACRLEPYMPTLHRPGHPAVLHSVTMHSLVSSALPRVSLHPPRVSLQPPQYHGMYLHAQPSDKEVRFWRQIHPQEAAAADRIISALKSGDLTAWPPARAGASHGLEPCKRQRSISSNPGRKRSRSCSPTRGRQRSRSSNLNHGRQHNRSSSPNHGRNAAAAPPAAAAAAAAAAPGTKAAASLLVMAAASAAAACPLQSCCLHLLL